MSSSASPNYKHSKWIQKAIDAMSKYNPNWENFLSAKSGETLCIPDCLDINIDRWRPAVDEKAAGFIKYTDENMTFARENAVAGDKGEDKFLSVFRCLKIGGILLQNFNSTLLYKKMNVKGGKIPEQKPDFIFFHNRIGVLFIEIKGIDEERIRDPAKRENEWKRSLGDAAEQIKQRMHNMPKIFQEVLDPEKPTVRVLNAIGLPFINLKDDADKSIVPEGTLVINKSLLADVVLFKKTITEFVDLDDSSLNESELDITQKLVAVLIYGSTTMIQISHALNAIAINTIINQASYLKERMGKKNLRGKDELQSLTSEKFMNIDKPGVSATFFFNNEQTKALYHHDDENNPKIQIITGLPGTGKTLIWMVQALRATKKERKKGSTIKIDIVLPDDLVPITEQFFAVNKDEHTKTDPVCWTQLAYENIIDKSENYSTKENEENRLFMDERNFDSSCLLKKILDKKLYSGRITAVVTGFLTPVIITSQTIRKRLQALESENNCSVYNLHTVVRGTNNIINKWKQKFAGIPMYVGHKITGSNIKKIKCKNIADVLQSLYDEIITYMEPLVSDGIAWKPQHIAIVCISYSPACEIKVQDYLEKEKHISCDNNYGTAGKLTVCTAIDTPSHEWPVVIVVCFERTELYENSCLLAWTRAIAKLTIIKLDFGQIHETVGQLHAHSLQMALLDFEKLTKTHFEIMEQFGVLDLEHEYNSSYTVSDTVMITIIRHNYIDPEIRQVEGFENCSTLSNGFEILEQNDKLVSDIAFACKFESTSDHNCNRKNKMQEILRYLHDIEENAMKISKEKIPYFLRHSWRKALSEVAKSTMNDRWETVCKLIDKLIAFNVHYSQLSNGNGCDSSKPGVAPDSLKNRKVNQQIVIIFIKYVNFLLWSCSRAIL